MTSYWGPLGWMTLHTIAALYPDTPTLTERELARQWVGTFAECITCPSCQGHFKQMYATYMMRHPEIFSSRRNLLLFTLRAHNTVNRRTIKKVYTIEECFADFTKFGTDYARSKRREYTLYLQKDWGKQASLSGISSLMRVRELSMIESQYWSLRQLDWDSVRLLLDETDDILTPIVPLPTQSPTSNIQYRINPQRFKLRNGGSILGGNASSMLISR